MFLPSGWLADTIELKAHQSMSFHKHLQHINISAAGEMKKLHLTTKMPCEKIPHTASHYEPHYKLVKVIILDTQGHF